MLNTGSKQPSSVERGVDLDRGWQLGALLAQVILLWGFLSPLLSTYGPLPDVSGSEGLLALVGWALAVLFTGSITGLDWLIFALASWSVISALANDRPIAAAVLYVALLGSPFTFLRLLLQSTRRGVVSLRATIVFLIGAQLVLLAFQLVTRVTIDDLKGTFVGTQYGEHVAAFVVLVGASVFALHRPRSVRTAAVLVLAVATAFVADSKMGLVYFAGVGLAYVLFGRSASSLRRLSLFKRIVLGAVGVAAMAGFYVGAFGNIALSTYVDRSVQTGGGKVAVTEEILNPDSTFWHYENYLLGAGPAQTVSRTAGLTVPNRLQIEAPAAAFGIPRGQYFVQFEGTAAGQGYVGRSSATKAASSLLGVMGDLGLVGLALYGALYGCVYRWVGRALGYFSWPALAWLGLLVPGFLGEWLEFPATCMFLIAVLAYLVRTAGPGATPDPAARPLAQSTARTLAS